MAQVTGVIEAKSNKFGKFSILLDNGTWYSSKFEIKGEKGDTVEFDDGGKNYCQKLRVVGGGSASAPSSSGGGGSTYTPAAKAKPGFPVPVDTKDRSIVRQNALAHATNIWKTLMEKQPPVDKVMTDKEVEKFLEKSANMINDIAIIFESYTSGDADAAAVEEMMKEAS